MAHACSAVHVIAIDLADNRLGAARFGADVTINNGRVDPKEPIARLDRRSRADVAIEAVGVPSTFELAASLIQPVAGEPTSVCTASRQPSTSKSSGSRM